MYIHTIDFEYFYKNAPDVILESRMVAPVATSTEARIYFWYHLGLVDDIEWSELDNIYITQVMSHYIKDAK